MDINEYVKVKLQIRAKKATPAPPVGPVLGQYGVNLINFCKKFNEATKDCEDIIIPVEIKIYKNKDFDFILKTTPTPILLKKILNLSCEGKPGSGAKNPGKQVVAKVSLDQIKEIAKIKFKDTNSYEIEKVMNSIIGTAKSMGIEIIK